MKVAIVLSTYNGEKYLEEQINSILLQDAVEIDLYVRDDGSTDNTINILKRYEQRFDNVFVEYGKNIGFRRSFINKLLQISPEYDLYAFCDQDDFWEKDKMWNAYKKISDNSNNDKPILYFSNLNICDEKLKVKKKTSLHKRKNTLESVILRRSIAGCTMVFNNVFLKLLLNRKITDNMLVRGHDSFLITLCYAIDGIVICDSNAYIKYRKHDNNTSLSTSTIYGRIRKEYEMMVKKKGKESLIASELLEVWGDLIKDNNRLVLQTIRDIQKINNRLVVFFDCKYSCGNILFTILGKLKVLLGLL